MKSIVKSNWKQIIILVALLVVILMIMNFLKADRSKSIFTTFPEFQEPAKVIDNKYYNKLYGFGIARPHADWEFSYPEKIDSLRKQDSSLPLLKNLNLMVKLFRQDLSDTISIVQIGIIDLIEPQVPQSLAEQSLAEIVQSYSFPDTVRVIRGVTLSGYGTKQGAYFMIEYPDRVKWKYPTWIFMYVVRNQFAYTVICQVRNELYDFMRKDFESILTSFRFY